MTLFRATVLDTPEDPFTGAPMRAEGDVALLVRDGVIAERGPWAALRSLHPDEPAVELAEGLLLPGFVDTHVHFPQVRVIGGLGMPLLDWLEQCALPEEERLADPKYACGVAEDFVAGLVRSGTTTALVFGAHFAPAVDALFEVAAAAGLRITSGLVVSDRLLRPSLLTTPARGHEEGLALAGRWHGRGRARYAVIPRFSLSCSDEMLRSCRALLDDVPGALFTSHLNENLDEILRVERLHDCTYAASYDKHGLLGPGSVLAHDVHPSEDDLVLLAARGAGVSHCPTSNAALASGVFPLARHVAAGVHVSLGSDVGAGTGFSLLKEGLQAYFAQQQLGAAGYPLTPAHLLHLATAAGAAALGMSDLVGELSVGKRFDAVWLRPSPSSTLGVALRHAPSPEAALARVFALGTDADVAAVWIDGETVVEPPG